MNINILEKKIEELKQNDILPEDFSLKIIAYKDHDVKIAAGNVDDAVFKWDSNGKGYIGYEKGDDLYIDDEGEIQLGKSIQFRHYPSLNC